MFCFDFYSFIQVHEVVDFVLSLELEEYETR